MSDNNNKKKEVSYFKNTDQIKVLYGGNDYLRQGLRAGGFGGFLKAGNKDLGKLIAETTDADKLREYSIDAKTFQNYADIVNYFKTMFYYRYTVVPVMKLDAIDSKTKMEIKVDEKERDLSKVNRQMLEAVEGLNLSANLPSLIETGMFEGYVTVYLEKIDDEVLAYTLPNEYSKPLLTSSYGAKTVVFDLEYFTDTLEELKGAEASDILVSGSDTKKNVDKAREEIESQQIKSIMEFFPKELRDAYKLYAQLDESYKATAEKGEPGPQFVHLDAYKAAIIPFSPTLAPPKIKTVAAEERLNTTLNREATKADAELDKVFTHQIPIHDGEPILTVPEAVQMQKSMENALDGAANVKVLTTFGITQMHNVHKNANEKNDIIKESFDSLYSTSAINPELFRSNTDFALKVSLERNKAFVWDIIQIMMQFYNVSINQQFDFGSYKCAISLLPISKYDEAEKVDAYRKSAEFGIGRLNAIVATGQKQYSLLDEFALEKALNLDELLTPLNSTHTQSNADRVEKNEKVTEVDNKTEIKKEVQDEKK